MRSPKDVNTDTEGAVELTVHYQDGWKEQACAEAVAIGRTINGSWIGVDFVRRQ